MHIWETSRIRIRMENADLDPGGKKAEIKSDTWSEDRAGRAKIKILKKIFVLLLLFFTLSRFAGIFLKDLLEISLKNFLFNCLPPGSGSLRSLSRIWIRIRVIMFANPKRSLFGWHLEYLNVVLDGRRPSGTPTSRLYTPRCPPWMRQLRKWWVTSWTAD